ncbi:hypothetical protein [Coprobacter fastidiosus]|uniref:hypothetical protein n=1 Tax=Coprobacter fastidiosus TaxID=1099853 RepID=UPI001DC82DD1|nr:hypothetical protein [Coprobacter fastidiosus]HJF43526.1 hypothetical protein [Coprobacter fastidiosus]
MEKAFNFDINEKYIQPTADNIGHELPYFNMPNWKSLNEQYKMAAKGASEELKGLKAKRLCSYLDIYARSSRQSVVILHADKNQLLKNLLEPVEDKDIFFTLTGLFVDMPEGRFHYVELNNVYKFNTLDIWNRYNIRGTYPYNNYSGGYKYGFVREDLIKIQETEFSVSIEDVKKVHFGYSLETISPELRTLISEEINTKGYNNVIRNKEEVIIRKYLPLTGYKPITYTIQPNSSLSRREYNPEYYNYQYEYYEYPENGFSYLYMMLPRYYYQGDRFVYDWKISRVTGYRNHGNTEMLNETNVEPDTKETTDTNKILKYTALTAGAILLGRALNG